MQIFFFWILIKYYSEIYNFIIFYINILKFRINYFNNFIEFILKIFNINNNNLLILDFNIFNIILRIILYIK